MDNSIRILVADDHALFRSGIISLLEDAKEIFVVGQVENGQLLIDKYFELRPHVVLVDISMPVISGLEAISKIKEKDSSVKALFLSMHEGEDYIYHCLKAGGMGLISKNVLRGELVFAIRSVFKGMRYFGAGWTDEKLDELIKEHEESHKSDIVELTTTALTSREVEILLMIGEGMTSNEIADKTSLSRRTIDSHRFHLMQKLNIKTLPELIKYAIQFSIKYNQKL